jgi:hypothetical protein
VPSGEYGTYEGPFLLATLPSGDTLTVYRVKTWTLTEGGHALQLEFQTRVPITDTSALRMQFARVWSVFAPYAEESGAQSAILTATDLRLSALGTAASFSRSSFGFIVSRDSSGVWRADDGTFLPVPVVPQNGAGIFTRDGRRL